jgi:energy-coupling factor transport system permease protein
VIARIEPDDRAVASPIGTISPLGKVAIALGWLIALAFTTRIGPPLVLSAVVIVLAVAVGRVAPARLVRALLPLWLVALAIGVTNALVAAANADPAATELLRLGPLRVTEPAVLAGAGLAARVLALAVVGATFAQTTDSTHLVDSLVQQGRLPDRFAYGALAAYQAVPRFSEDLTTIRQARRIRGLRGEWHPRVLVGLLVLAIRHGDRLALAMDARGFGMRQRTRYREVRWQWTDAVAAIVAVAIAAVALLVPF